MDIKTASINISRAILNSLVLKSNYLKKGFKSITKGNIQFLYNSYKKGGVSQVCLELKAFKARLREKRETMTLDLIDYKEISNLSDCQSILLKKYDKPDVSIIIPVYNQFSYTYNCLKSIEKFTDDVKYEVIIADDLSTDLTTRLSSICENLIVVRNETNLRFLLNCNNASKYARGKYLLFLNNDTQVQDKWLSSLISLIESDESIGMVGSKLVYPDGTLQEAGGIIWNDASGWNYGRNQNPLLPEFNYVRETDYISGASIMIRKSLWNEIGGFDERYVPAYNEDSDLAFEVRKHGYKVLYQPESVVVHFEGKSNGTDLTSGQKAYQVTNAKKFHDKWKDELTKHHLPNGQDIFLARDKSIGRKSILFIDHYVPEYDKDAGSKTVWQYLLMFVRKGYKVIFWSDNLVKSEPYTTMLQQIGIFVIYGSNYNGGFKEWININGKYINFAFINRPHISIKYIDDIKSHNNIKVIYYGHDFHYLRLKREYDLTGNRLTLKEAEKWKSIELELMHKADVSYYPSRTEVDEIKKLDASINVKDLTAYVYDSKRNDINKDFNTRKDILFVGGFGHPPNADAVKWFIKDIYPHIREKQDINFHIVGSKMPDEIKEMSNQNGIIVEGFVTDERLKELYDNVRLVVVPLRYGAGVKGKVVEAMYNGLPIVTTKVGAEGISDSSDVFMIADNSELFAKKVLNLYNDTKQLKQLSEAALNFIDENYTTDAAWAKIEEYFR